VAVSLHEVAAGAAVNEDFSSVVDHCKEMLKGDQSLDYLVITKNDGFSLIHDRTGWRVGNQCRRGLAANETGSRQRHWSRAAL
jgi:two-component system NtrC family sensor kinase